MKNKTADVNNLLRKLSKEDISGYEFVNYWNGDTTAIGLKKRNVLIYISTFDFSQTGHYDIIMEEFETGEILKERFNISYTELVADLQGL